MRQTPKSIVIYDKPLGVSKILNALKFPGRGMGIYKGKTQESTEPYKLLLHIFSSLNL